MIDQPQEIRTVFDGIDTEDSDSAMKKILADERWNIKDTKQDPLPAALDSIGTSDRTTRAEREDPLQEAAR